MAAYSKAILFYNDKAGSNKSDKHRQVIRDHLDKNNIDLEIVEVPKPHQEIETIVSKAISDGADLILAAGGDGTISFVGNALIGKNVPLGILPMGTGNLLAKGLNIPQNLEEALELVTSQDHSIIKIDTFLMGDRHYLLNMSVGLTPEVMEKTDSEDKQRIGNFAYFFNFIEEILGFKLHKFYLECDQQKSKHFASEILVTNGRSTGIEGMNWSEEVSLNDGTLNMFIIRAVNISDIFGLIFSLITKREKLNPDMKSLQVKNYCRIETKTPLRIQADGDSIGETPVEVHVKPKSLNIIIGSETEHQVEPRSAT